MARKQRQVEAHMRRQSAVCLQKVPRGMVLFSAGEPVDGLYVVVNGALAVRAPQADGSLRLRRARAVCARPGVQDGPVRMRRRVVSRRLLRGRLFGDVHHDALGRRLWPPGGDVRRLRLDDLGHLLRQGQVPVRRRRRVCC